MKRLPLLGVLLFLAGAGAAAAAPVRIVAAENFYGDVAKQIGGPAVTVHSILSNPDTDPHLFEASPSAARALAHARVVIANGIGYDAWMAKLLRAAGGSGRTTITVAALVGRKPGDNPHIWYDPRTMLALARDLARRLGEIDPDHRADYQARLARFVGSMQPIEAKVAALRARFAGIKVAATEPVFGCMLAALGVDVTNNGFQLAVMNNTEPSAAEIAKLEDDLKNRRVKLLVYNSQATDPVAARMLALAKSAHIPVVAVTETEPAGASYQSWVAGELDAVARALPR